MSEYLHDILISCLDKAQECGFNVVPIVFDGASTNCKVVRKLLKALNFSAGGKPAPLAELNLQTYFICKENKYFVLFCIVHIIKCVRNALFRKDNYFAYPKLCL